MNKANIGINIFVLMSLGSSISIAQVGDLHKNASMTNPLTAQFRVKDIKSSAPKDNFEVLRGQSNPVKNQGDLGEEVKIKLKSLMGGVNGGGGDQVGLQFATALKTALHKIETTNPKLFSEIGPKVQLNSYDRRIVVVDEALDVQLGDLIQNSVAVNIPVLNLILVNRSRWAEVSESELQEGIALHEALSLVGLEQTGYYPYSSVFVLEQGLAKAKLSKALAINRLKQISAENPKLSRHQILEKFFNEALQDIDFNDIGDESDSQNIKRKCVMIYGENDSAELRLNYTPIVIKPGSDTKPAEGPLFPEIPAIPAITAPGVIIQARVTLDYSQPLNLHDRLKRTSPQEIIVSAPAISFSAGSEMTHEVHFRKNNGLLVLRWRQMLNASPGNAAYAYCYPQQ
jgi:hypothetical protein